MNREFQVCFGPGGPRCRCCKIRGRFSGKLAQAGKIRASRKRSAERMIRDFD